jgi:hypothetical protein
MAAEMSAGKGSGPFAILQNPILIFPSLKVMQASWPCGPSLQRGETDMVLADRFHPLISILADPAAAFAGYSISIARASPGNSET